ncbi:unnamed protein product, partial [Sphacelaria rigidula]
VCLCSLGGRQLREHPTRHCRQFLCPSCLSWTNFVEILALTTERRKDVCGRTLHIREQSSGVSVQATSPQLFRTALFERISDVVVVVTFDLVWPIKFPVKIDMTT